ncbi:MAG: TatD family hydrolase [Actinomycetota bacterium]
MVDTHAHLGVCEPPQAELVGAARDAGVDRILDVGMDEASNRAAIAAADAADEVYASVGRHPNSAMGFDESAAADIEALAEHPRVRAIGETGLDYYRDRAPRDDQRAAFEAQIEIARRAGLPLVIHMRDSQLGADPQPRGGAVEDTFEMLGRLADGVTVVLHCFSASERVMEATENAWYCSFAGNLTYPKASGLRESAAQVPEELLLVETDAPFLAPQPVRGKPNQPAHVVATAEALAEVRGVTYAELERVVERNAAKVFGW